MPVVIPPPSGASGYVELSRRPQGGRILEKHVLSKGPLVHPKTGAVINIDDSFVAKLKANFDSGVVPHVQLPLANEKNQHDERPDRNLGEVLDIRERNGKIYAVLEARKQSEDFGVTLLDASAMVDLDALDTRTNQKVGPALLHVAVTNRPHLVDLEGYTDTIAASADLDDEVVMLSYPQEGTVPTDQLTTADLAGAITQLAQLTGHGAAVRNLGLSEDQQDEIMRLTASNPRMFRQPSVYPLAGESVSGEVLRLTADPRNAKLFGTLELSNQLPAMQVDVTDEVDVQSEVDRITSSYASQVSGLRSGSRS